MSNEILEAIEKHNQAFLAFKTRNDAKIAEQAATIEKLEAKMFNRPGNGGGDLETHSRSTRSGIVYDSPECKAFSTYMRSGGDRELKAMDISNPSEGGYGLPKQISSVIDSLMLRYSPMRRLSTVEQAFTQDYHKLVSDPRTTASGWVGEMAARPATNTPTLYDQAPPMGEIYANPQITQQALDDLFFNAEAFLVDAVTQNFLANEGAAFINGSGVNQPKGILQYATSPLADDTRPVGTIGYTPSGAAAGFLATTATVSPFDVLQSTLFGMKPQWRRDAAWLCNSATLALLAGIKDNTGRYVLVPNQTPGFPMTLLGLPIWEDPYMPAIAANSFPIALLSPRAYLIVDRVPIRFLRDPYTNRPYVGLYVTKRLGGGLLVSEAIRFVKIATA